MYFPVAVGALPDGTDEPVEREATGGNETVLIAEDEEILRPLPAKMLDGRGYTTIVTGSALEAIRDRQERMKVLFMSGYAGDTVKRSGALEVDAAFIEKPFTADELSRRVRETLDRGAKPA